MEKGLTIKLAFHKFDGINLDRFENKVYLLMYFRI